MLSHSGACRCMESDLYLNVLWNLYPCSGRTAAFIKYSFTWFWNHAFPQPSQICPAEPLRVGSVLSSGTHPSWIPSSPKLSHTCTLKKKKKKKKLKEAVQRHCRWFMSGWVHQKNLLEQKGSGLGRGQPTVSSTVINPGDTLWLVTPVKLTHACTILCNRTGGGKAPNST